MQIIFYRKTEMYLKSVLSAILLLICQLALAQIRNFQVSTSSISSSAAVGTAVSGTFTISNAGNAAVTWEVERVSLGDEVSFSKAGYADWTLPSNQDRISSGVWITRKNNQGLFNISQETGYSSGVSPEDTEWAFGSTSELSEEDYDIWGQAIDWYPPSQVGTPMSMHIISENRYFDVLFDSWGAVSGGAFSYTRQELNPPFLTFSTQNGTLSAQTSTEITYTFDAASLVEGVYYGNIYLTSNASTSSDAVIAFELTVTGGTPTINVDADFAFNDTYVGGSETLVLYMENTGTGPLKVSNITSNTEAFTMAATSMTIAAESYGELEVTFTPDAVGSYTGSLTITSNDSGSPTIVSISGTGLAGPVAALSATAFTQTLAYGESVTQILTLQNTGADVLNWSATVEIADTETSFAKADYADWTLAENQDLITPSVAITRQNKQGLFNILKESSYNSSAPSGTEWYYGSTNEGLQNSYTTWVNAVDYDPLYQLETVMSMHATTENRYFDIQFTKWTANDAGGGIAYTRKEVPGWIILPVSSGEIAADNSSDISLTLDANRYAGTYAANIILTTNDPDNQEIIIPVTLIVTGTPEVSLDATALDFGDAYVGFPDTLQLTVTNAGSAELDLTGFSLDNSAFSVVEDDLELAPGSSGVLHVVYSASGVGSSSGTLTITTNDPDNPSVSLDLTATALMPPDIGVTYNELVLDMSGSASLDETITISNTGGSDLIWSFGEGEVTELEKVLENLNNNYTQITSLIPSRYDFTYDLNYYSGEPIGLISGGNSMYNYGNYLVSDYVDGPPIVYSDNEVWDQVDPLYGDYAFGSGSKYFTRNLPGLFVLAADMNDVSEFGTASGTIGNGGSGSADTVWLAMDYNNKRYQGFVRRVYGGATPSVNHLIIIEQDPNVSHTVSSSVTSDEQMLAGLNDVTRIYYLLFSSTDGGYIDNSTMEEIMSAFLVAIKDIPSYVTLSEENGTLEAANSTSISLSIDPAEVPEGVTEVDLYLNSNDPDQPLILVPITFTNNTFAHIAISDTDLDFGDAYIGIGDTLDLQIANYGTADLEIAFSSDNELFSVVADTTVAAGDTILLAVVYNPVAEASTSGMLTLTTNDSDNETIEIALSGNGLTASEIVVDPLSFRITMHPGDTYSGQMTIGNTQGEDLSWEIGSIFGSLETNLKTLDANLSTLTTLIPNMYEFSYDGDDTYISDGGDDMYDGGNYIYTDLGSYVEYSDAVITDGSSYFGDGTEYFTRNVDGLFVLGAELNDVSEFGLYGNLGADGGGNLDTTILEVNYKGTVFQGFVKRVYNAGDPSVNHLIIIPKDANVTQTAASSTDDDEHILEGLNNVTRLYYLLYASSNGGYIDNDETRSIMETFISMVVETPGFLTFSTQSGIDPEGSTTTVDLSINADDVTSTRETFDVYVRSNDPLHPVVTVSFDVQVSDIIIEEDLEDLVMNEGFGSTTLDVSTNFSDAEDDELTYVPVALDTEVVTTSASGAVITITEAGIGTTEISVAATDGTNTVYTNFNFRVNAVPVVLNPVSDQSYGSDFVSDTLAIAGVFSDADDSDVLVYSVAVSDERIVTADLISGVLVLSKMAYGTTTVTLTVSDGFGGEATDEFTVVVDKQNQSVTFDALATKTYGDADFDLVATATSGLEITYSTSDESVVTISGSTVTIIGAGTASITASQAGDADFNEATAVTQTLLVNQAQATITLSDLEQDADGSEKSPTVTTVPDGLAYMLTFDGESTLPADAGSYEVIATIEDANYSGSDTATFVLKEVLGLKTQEQLVLYPNPVITSFMVKAAKEMTFTLFDIEGSYIRTGVTNEILDASNLASGIYIICVGETRLKLLKR